MKADEIIDIYTAGELREDDIQLRAAIGKVASDRSKELTESITLLRQALPLAISELRQTITRNADNMIVSNEKLSQSNERYSKWMKWLTFALVFIGVVQVIVSLITLL